MVYVRSEGLFPGVIGKFFKRIERRLATCRAVSHPTGAAVTPTVDGRGSEGCCGGRFNDCIESNPGGER